MTGHFYNSDQQENQQKICISWNVYIYRMLGGRGVEYLGFRICLVTFHSWSPSFFEIILWDKQGGIKLLMENSLYLGRTQRGATADLSSPHTGVEWSLSTATPTLQHSSHLETSNTQHQHISNNWHVPALRTEGGCRYTTTTTTTRHRTPQS